MMKRMKAVLRTICLALTGCLLGVSIYSWNARQILGNQLPMPFGFGMSIVLSGSMEPALRVNDLVIIAEAENVAVGDILVYQSGNSLVIHRLIALEGETLILQGDANNTPDAPVTREAIRGKFLFAIPGAGWAVRQMRKPAVLVALLAAAVWLMEWSYRKEKEEDSAELEDLQSQIRQLMDEMKEE